MPRSREIETDMFPRLDHVSVTFDEAGLVTVALDEVEIEVAATLSAYSERLAHRAISPLARLSENEMSAGLARIEADAAADRLEHQGLGAAHRPTPARPGSPWAP